MIPCRPLCIGLSQSFRDFLFNLIALRKAKIVYNFGLSECNRVKDTKIIQLIFTNKIFVWTHAHGIPVERIL